MTPIEWIAQGFGILATILTFLTYIMKTPRWVAVMNGLSCVALILSYALLGAWEGSSMLIVCVIRNFFLLAGEKKRIYRSPVILVVLLAAILTCGILTWEKWYSILEIAALLINTTVMWMKNNKWLRCSILVTCPMVAGYDIAYGAYGSIPNEILAITSSIIGLIAYRKKEKQEKETV